MSLICLCMEGKKPEVTGSQDDLSLCRLLTSSHAHCTSAVPVLPGPCSKPSWASLGRPLKPKVLTMAYGPYVIRPGQPQLHLPTLFLIPSKPLAPSLFIGCLQAHSGLRTFTLAVSSVWNTVHSALAFPVSGQISLLHGGLPAFLPLPLTCARCWVQRRSSGDGVDDKVPIPCWSPLYCTSAQFLVTSLIPSSLGLCPSLPQDLCVPTRAGPQFGGQLPHSQPSLSPWILPKNPAQGPRPTGQSPRQGLLRSCPSCRSLGQRDCVSPGSGAGGLGVPPATAD